MYKKVILVAYDSDFVPAVQEAKNEGLIVYACFSRITGTGIHDELHSICDDRIELTADILSKIPRSHT